MSIPILVGIRTDERYDSLNNALHQLTPFQQVIIATIAMLVLIMNLISVVKMVRHLTRRHRNRSRSVFRSETQFDLGNIREKYGEKLQATLAEKIS